MQIDPPGILYAACTHLVCMTGGAKQVVQKGADHAKQLLQNRGCKRVDAEEAGDDIEPGLTHKVCHVG